MKVTNRDLDIFRWINAMGFASAKQVSVYTGMHLKRAQRRLKKLIDHGFLSHKKILHGNNGVYILTSIAAQICGSELPPLPHIRLGSFLHDSQMIDLGMDLAEKYKADFVSDRQLKHQISGGPVGKKGHIPDGALVLPDGKKIGVELELTQKGSRRLREIFRQHMRNIDFKEIWYFCGSDAVTNAIKSHADKTQFVRIFKTDMQEIVLERK
jgi:hypothetical protein